MMELRLRRARHQARAVLSQVGAEGQVPVPVEGIAHALGVEVIHGGVTGALASVIRVGGAPRIRLGDRHDHPGQVRFSIAHELGHLVLDHPAKLDVALGEDGHCQSKDAESEADAFAAELLLPESMVRRRCEVSPVSLDVVRNIADDFGTSMLATAIRFAELTSERCAAVFSQDGQIRWAVRSSTFWPELRRGQRLSPWSLADDYFSSHQVHDVAQPVPASAWIDGSSAVNAEIIEHAMLIPQQHAVLSLLWIPESCRLLAYRS